MEEYLDLVDENNKLTGKNEQRSVIHSTGLWHRTVHIYIFRETDGEIEFLMHLRSKNKDLQPNCWDTRFGGHIKSGESVEEGINNELMEELGLKLEQINLIKGEVYKKDHYPNREFTYSFYYKFDGDLANLKFNDGEVQEIKWMKVGYVLESMDNGPEVWAGSKSSFTNITNVLKNTLDKK